MNPHTGSEIAGIDCLRAARTDSGYIKVDRILLRFDHMTRHDLLVEMVKKSICIFRNNINKHSATKEM